MVELVEILDGRLGKRSVERVRYVINNLLHLVIVKYGDISLVLCISTRLRLVTILSLLVTILSLLVKYLVIGERAKRARHTQVCSIENRGYIYILLASERSERDTLWSVQLRIADIYIIYYGTCNFVLITRKEGGA